MQKFKKNLVYGTKYVKISTSNYRTIFIFFMEYTLLFDGRSKVIKNNTILADNRTYRYEKI